MDNIFKKYYENNKEIERLQNEQKVLKLEILKMLKGPTVCSKLENYTAYYREQREAKGELLQVLLANQLEQFINKKASVKGYDALINMGLINDKEDKYISRKPQLYIIKEDE